MSKIALVHDYFIQMGGAERVAIAMHDSFPVCAHLHDGGVAASAAAAFARGRHSHFCHAMAAGN